MLSLGREINYLRKILFILALPFIFIVLSPDIVLSQADEISKVLRTPLPLSQAPSISSQGIGISQSTDPRIKKIETRLRESQDTVQSKKNRTSDASGAPAGRQNSIAEKIRKKLADVAEVRFRSHNGTPRQIKVKAEARRNGAVLEKASAGPLTGEARDEETAKNFLRSRRNDLRVLNPDQEFSLSKYSQDGLGRRHLRYRQQYQGLPVWPAELNVHLDAGGNVDLMNGAFIPTPRRLITQPVWSADKALNQARKTVPAGEKAIAGPPELIVYASEVLGARLGWKCELSVSPESDWLVVVDALNGNVLTAYNQVQTELAAGSGQDLFGDTRALDTWREGGKYYLTDTSKSMYDPTSNPPSADKTRGGILVYDMANSEDVNNGLIVSSASATSGWLAEGVSLAYSLSETYDYFDERHNREGIDNQKGSILGFVRYGQDYENAFWTSEYNAVFFGDGVPYAGALDVVAHEITHGVTSFTCNLIYQDQPGAINEAFSDIFGEMVEARTDGGTDWLHGTVLNDKRSLRDPSSIEISETGYYYPSKMSEFYGRNHPLLQKFVDQDYGGVHINMTIASHCFYLLAQGMAGAIGIRDAERIFYRAQTVHLVSNSQFIDLRLACIVAAEELFGAGAAQVQKVKDAFDEVEIFDNPSTPEPPPLAPVEGDDGVVFLSYDPDSSGFYLARYEDTLGDASPGAWLSCYDLEVSRPSVSGDGSLAFFVDSLEDACFIPTDGSLCEECLGFPDTIHSVSMSPDGQVYGMVLLDGSGNRDNSITVIDLRPGGVTRTFVLVAPATEGVTVNTVQFADTMDFSSDNRYLFYDAYNIIEFRDGTELGVWSIYAIDLVTEQTFAIAGPFPDYDIGYPAIGQTNSALITFDMMDQISGETVVVALDLLSGDFADVGYVTGGNWTVPCYAADDSAIIYSIPDYQTNTLSSLVRQPLGSDSITPLGSPVFYLPDAYSGVMYRRGTFTPPVPEINVAPQSLAFGSVAINSSRAKTIKISNAGTSDLMITETAITGINKTLYKISGGCTGQTLPPSGECVFTVNFIPASAGVKNATLTIKSSDPDAPAVNVALSGTGTSGGAGAPAPPTNVAASDRKFSGKVQVTWNASSGATSYDVYRADMPAWTGVVSPKKLASASKTIYDDASAVPGRQYYYWVKARNSRGVSRYSLFDTGYIGTAGSPPPPPTGVSASDGTPGKVKINWNATSGALVYEIWRAAKPVAEGGKPFRIGFLSGTSFDDTSGTPGATYYYWIKSRDSWGSSKYSLPNTGYRN